MYPKTLLSPLTLPHDAPPMISGDISGAGLLLECLYLPPANEVCEGYVFTGVCLSTRGGMHGCSGGGQEGMCVVAPGGACMVAPGGHAWLLLGGHVWLLQGACMVAPRGGMCGCSGGGMHGCSWGGCV